jgi:hypothetical protein
MSDFPLPALQIWAMEPRDQRSQFRAGKNAGRFHFVSQAGPGAQWHGVAACPAVGDNAPGDLLMQAILADMPLCAALGSETFVSADRR